ncbi:MAG: type I-C CRISPR-associated protein Cas8c/Csd1, partial [Pseudorhodoplanes sp.]
MSVLAALNGYYDRLAKKDAAPPYGYSYENISFAIILSPEGKLVDVQDVRVTSDGRPRPRRLAVPNDPRSTRTSGIAPYFLWDKTAYVFGVTEGSRKRTAQEHAAFKELHNRLLSDSNDEGFGALRGFLNDWTPDHFEQLRDAEEIMDSNVVFRLDGEHGYLHDRSAGKGIWQAFLREASPAVGMCLITGAEAPLATLHPPIRGVYGAQMAGAYIVSFNINAFESYGLKSGANAPVSERAAFGYTTALNKLLERGSTNRVQIADASTVFWAEASEGGETAAETAEGVFSILVDPPAPDDEQEAAQVRDVLDKIEKGRPLEEAEPGVEEGTDFYVLGLSPNAARLSIRFWYEGTFGDLARRFRDHWDALRIEPMPWRTAPSLWRLLYETAAQRKAENIPPLLAGELMRAILTGGRYPRTLLSAVITRMRADQDINGMRAAICKACLVRNGEDIDVSLNREETNPGYRLGRLFAVLESVQRAALGKVNATIRDRYYGAASATPASVFPVLLRNTGHHLSSLRKGDKSGLAHWFETEMGQIVDGLKAQFPSNLRIEDQGRF